MNSVLTWAKTQQTAFVELVRELVECESPSDDAAALARFAELFSSIASPVATVRKAPGGHLLCKFSASQRQAKGQILVLAHYDTVWPLGTLEDMPFRHTNGRLWGPGVLDMKGGIAIFLFAMKALKELQIPLANNVLLQMNADEEVGSASSRALTETNARQSKRVFVLEPGTGLCGKLKTSRKGVGGYTLKIQGKAAHAGVDFANGASAILEIARQVQKIAGFTNMDRGITVNPGLIAGGTRTNVIAAQALVEVDFRIQRLRDAEAVDRKFRGLKPFDRRCSLEISGGLNRPPMERTSAVASLFRKAEKIGRDMGVVIEESSTGGGSDGNFSAALGVPTLDGLGAVGEGAHAPNESILLDRVPNRIALLAGLLSY